MTDNGGPAFPVDAYYELGLTKREWFAGMASTRAYDEGGRYGPEGLKQCAVQAYLMADAMLAAGKEVHRERP